MSVVLGKEALAEGYVMGEEIAVGRFGTVRYCTLKTTGEAFAIKSIDTSAITDPLDLDCVEKEAKLTRLVSGHPHLITLHAVCTTPTSIHLVLDLCSPRTLHDRISPLLPLRETHALSVFRPLVSAIAHCHRIGIAHRDIKPENILFDGNNRLRLADLGSAGEVGTGMEGLVGTPYYVAPEVVQGRVYDEKVDVWSAGVVLYVMLGGMLPFDGESVGEMFEKVVRGSVRFPVRVWRGVSHEAKDLVRRMLCRDVRRRLTAEQVLRHPWVAKGGEEEDCGGLVFE